jgi:hypothetical protein
VFGGVRVSQFTRLGRILTEIQRINRDTPRGGAVKSEPEDVKETLEVRAGALLHGLASVPPEVADLGNSETHLLFYFEDSKGWRGGELAQGRRLPAGVTWSVLLTGTSPSKARRRVVTLIGAV